MPFLPLCPSCPYAPKVHGHARVCVAEGERVNKGVKKAITPYFIRTLSPSVITHTLSITRTPEGGKEGGTGKQRSTGASYLRFPSYVP